MKRLTLAWLLFIAPAGAIAQTSYPMVMSVKPVAAQIGHTSEHTVYSRYSLTGTYQVLVSGDHVHGEVVEPAAKDKKADSTELKVRLKVDSEAQPGVRDIRLATPRGVSTLGQLVVTRGKVVMESAKNDTVEGAATVEVPATLCGAIEKAEDVDFYKFRVGQGTSLSFHVRGMRLQDRIHDLQQHVDPILTLRSASGATIASSDNFFFGDPAIGHTFTKAGEYLLEIRDVRYQGNKYWEYSIEVSDAPFVTSVFPMGVRPNRPTRVSPVGFGFEPSLGDLLVASGQEFAAVKFGSRVSNPVPVAASDLPLAMEEEAAPRLVSAEAVDGVSGPSPTRNDGPPVAQVINFPVGINGCLSDRGDIDCFAFNAKKGERLSFEVLARRLQSSLDSQLRILDDKGKQLQANDDLQLGKRRSADSWIENWTVPADGRYVVELRDVHLRGGDTFAYFLRVTRSEPYFELYLDTDKTQLTPGTHGVMYVRVVRKNGFAGPIQLAISGLPAGVTASCGRILKSGQDGCIVLSAAKGASMAVSNVVVRGTAVLQSKAGATMLSARATAYQETYLPGGGRGHWPAQMHTVSVGGPSDVRAVHVEADRVTLKPGESKRVKVRIERAKGFSKNVILDVTYNHLGGVHGNSLPAGVTMDAGASKTLLTGSTTEGNIVFKAAKNAAAVESQQISIMANVSINFVMKTTFSSRPVLISVSPSK